MHETTEPSPQRAPSATARAARPMLDSDAISHDRSKLVDRLETDGYLFFRGLLDPDKVLSVRADLTAALHSIGWFRTPTAPQGIPNFHPTIGDDRYWEGLETILRARSLHDLTRDPALIAMIERIYGEPAMRQPRFVPRVVFPWPGNTWSHTAAHQDMPYVQGTLDTLTAWVPIGDCSSDGGALEVLRGSHRSGLRSIFGTGKYRCASTEVDENDPDWHGVDLQAGDVLIFTSLTIHRARRNTSENVRLTMDVRYQPVDSPICAQLTEPPFYPNVPDWPELLDQEELDRVHRSVGTESQPFVEPIDYTVSGTGRIFPWLTNDQ